MFCDFLVLSSERINGQRAKTSRKTMRERGPSLQNSKNPHAKVGPFFEVWRGGTRLRIVFLKVFARWPLVLSDDNTKPNKHKDLSLHAAQRSPRRVRPQLEN